MVIFHSYVSLPEGMFQTSFFLDLQAVPQPVPSLATLQGSAPPNAARDIHPALRTPQGR